MNKIYEDITVVTVLYNSKELAQSFFGNLENFRIIVVDNGRNEKILKKIKDYKNIKVISKNKNVGYGSAVNFAVENVTTKFFLILNPDLKIDEKSILSMYNILNQYNDCAIVAPVTHLSNDFYGAFPERNIKNLTLKNALKSRDLLLNSKIESEICVDVAKWALLIKTEEFKNIGGFNEKLFIFWEEIDLCRRFRSRKLSVIVTPKSNVKHNQEKSSDTDFQNFLIKTYYHEYSPLVYFNVQTFSFFHLKRIMKYFLRGISYLIILNLKKSLTYFLRLSANIRYFVNLKFSSKK
ncbi:glycosyltransferase family 2 protein [Candidatus Pelagibacter sp.]|nr:glycosyltransferase family 2 protein [Candidatus Pelagibacter sp.]